ELPPLAPRPPPPVGGGRARARGAAGGACPGEGLSRALARAARVDLRALRARVRARKPPSPHRPPPRRQPREQPAGRQQLGEPLRRLSRGGAQRRTPRRLPEPQGLTPLWAFARLETRGVSMWRQLHVLAASLLPG